MYSEEELIKILKKENIDGYKLSGDYEDNDRTIFLDIEFEDMIEFIKKRNINDVFYKFNYTCKEVLLITEEDMRRKSESFDIPYKEIIEVIKPQIDEYNDRVLELDFSKPHSVLIFCIYQGKQIGIFDANSWFFENQVMLPEDALEIIVDKNKNKIYSYINEKENESKIIKDEFHQFLLGDDKFHGCTNAKLRKNYIKHMWDNEEYRKFRNAFIKGNNFERYNEYFDFVEMVWREYKEILKRKSFEFPVIK